jgi:hypothetical protein
MATGSEAKRHHAAMSMLRAMLDAESDVVPPHRPHAKQSTCTVPKLCDDAPHHRPHRRRHACAVSPPPRTASRPLRHLARTRTTAPTLTRPPLPRVARLRTPTRRACAQVHPDPGAAKWTNTAESPKAPIAAIGRPPGAEGRLPESRHY